MSTTFWSRARLRRAGSSSPAGPGRTCRAACPLEALRKNSPVTGWPHSASAYAVTRSQRVAPPAWAGGSAASHRGWRRCSPRRRGRRCGDRTTPSGKVRRPRRQRRAARRPGRRPRARLEATDEADVLVVDVDVDEPTQVAALDEALLDPGVVCLEVVDERAQARTVTVHGLRAAVYAQDGRDRTSMAIRHSSVGGWARAARGRR